MKDLVDSRELLTALKPNSEWMAEAMAAHRRMIVAIWIGSLGWALLAFALLR